MEQNKHKQLGYVQIFLCYGIISALFYFRIMRANYLIVEQDIYLALNLIVIGALCFLFGLVINNWSLKSSGNPVPIVKIMIAVIALVLADVIVSAIIARNAGTAAPIAGGWLAFRAVLDSGATNNVFGFALPAWTMLFSIPVGIFVYRYACLSGKANKRLLAVFVILYMAASLTGYLNLLMHGGSFSFISARNFIDFGIRDIYRYITMLTGIHLICVILPRPKFNLRSNLRDYFRHEADNIKALVSRNKAE